MACSLGVSLVVLVTTPWPAEAGGVVDSFAEKGRKGAASSSSSASESALSFVLAAAYRGLRENVRLLVTGISLSDSDDELSMADVVMTFSIRGLPSFGEVSTERLEESRLDLLIL